MNRSVAVLALASCVSLLPASIARSAVDSDMVTPGGSSATVRIVMTITTALGTSTDDDIRTMTTTGTAQAAFLRNAAPFNSSQFNAMQLSFANTTFVFNFYCIPIFGCQVLNVTINNLQLTLEQPACSPIGAGGLVSFPAAVVRMTGSYSTTGIATASGPFDNTGPGALNGRITNPTSTTVKLDQVTLADQVFVVDPASLPTGVTALTIVIQPNLTNTTLSGPFAVSAVNYDADNDGLLDYCDSCTDTDGDGYGDPGFPNNTCALDNCPLAFNPDQTDTNGNGIGDACEVLPCPADINGDTFINVTDLLAVINGWGACAAPCPPYCAADVNHDCAVNVTDLLAVINGWGACP